VQLVTFVTVINLINNTLEELPKEKNEFQLTPVSCNHFF